MMPKPCMGPAATACSTSMSSEACGREGVADAIRPGSYYRRAHDPARKGRRLAPRVCGAIPT